MADRQPESAGQEEHLVRHIGFAERWLARARDEVTTGEVARSVLSLLLAEAEVHHAREQTIPGATPARPHPSPALMILTVTALAGVLLAGLALLDRADETGTGLSSGPVIVRFRQPGSMLALVPLVPLVRAPENLPVPAPAPAPSPDVRLRRERVGRGVLRPPAPRAPAMSQPAMPAKPAPAAPVLTDGDLIDLVIAAERSLRGERR